MPHCNNDDCCKREASLDEIWETRSAWWRKERQHAQCELTSNIHWHLLDLSAIELLNFTHHAHIILSDEVDCNTLSSESATTTDAVDVVLAVSRKIIVDDQGHLLHIDATGEEIGGDQNTRRARSKLLHDDIALSLIHFSVHSRDSEISRLQLVCEPVDLSASIAEDDSLCDGDSFVEIGQGIQLPLLFFHGNVELLDTFEGKLGLLDQDTDWITHEFGGDFENVLGHGGRQENNLSGLGQELEDVVDLLRKTTLKDISLENF